MGRTKHTITEKVFFLLGECDYPAALTLDQCAVSLSMSKSTFQRKLVQEETRFKHIQSKFLNELCVKALLTQPMKIDDLATKLGYSERATFERAFQQKFGIRPSQFRKLTAVGDSKGSESQLIKIAEGLPPLPESTQQLLKEKERNDLDIDRVIHVIEKDPIFVGRLMGLASKAVYGFTPINISQAISRNLGISTVINIAVAYAIRDSLKRYVEPQIIEQYTKAFLIAPKFFQKIRQSIKPKVKFDVNQTEQLLTFALIGILLLCHKETKHHQLVQYSLQGVDDLNSLNSHLQQSIGCTIYNASSLLLSLWHIDASLIKKLLYLDKTCLLEGPNGEQEDLLFFMLSCLYKFARHDLDYSEQEEKAQWLNIDNFADIKALCFEAE